jgi:hypothetical protein
MTKIWSSMVRRARWGSSKLPSTAMPLSLSLTLSIEDLEPFRPEMLVADLTA